MSGSDKDPKAMAAQLSELTEQTADLDLAAPGAAPTEEDRIGLDDLLLESEKPKRGAYDLDRDLAEEGKWFDWSDKLGYGPDGKPARLKIARVKNRIYTELWNKATEKFGDKRTGTIKLEKRLELLPVIHSKALLRGLENVVIRDKDGNPTASKTRVVFDPKGRRSEVTYTFALNPDGTIQDTQQNRYNLTLLGDPDLGDDVFKVANNDENYFDDDDKVRGN